MEGQFQIIVGVGISFCHLSYVYSEALEPALINKILLSNLFVQYLY